MTREMAIICQPGSAKHAHANNPAVHINPLPINIRRKPQRAPQAPSLFDIDLSAGGDVERRKLGFADEQTLKLFDRLQLLIGHDGLFLQRARRGTQRARRCGSNGAGCVTSP